METVLPPRPPMPPSNPRPTRRMPDPQPSPRRPERGRGVPVWLAAVIVAVACIAGALGTAWFLHDSPKDVDTELADESGAMANAATEVPPMYQYPGDPDATQWQLRSFDWLVERPIAYDDIASLSPAQLRLLRNAIYAIHGYRFKSADLRGYFEKYPWYTPTTDITPTTELSTTEQANIALIKKYE